ncbi:hypothetical protein LEP1GSC117_4388 [Leptospira interrogans serovar Icterohaemorrhagiae str. Verdun LP]|nr:hypothetical protein LEP1GSC117_4388 [Leptospira interrogans serovar Icterohaemorrhagiae str. Verdun LP]
MSNALLMLRIIDNSLLTIRLEFDCVSGKICIWLLNPDTGGVLEVHRLVSNRFS